MFRGWSNSLTSKLHLLTHCSIKTFTNYSHFDILDSFKEDECSPRCPLWRTCPVHRWFQQSRCFWNGRVTEVWFPFGPLILSPRKQMWVNWTLKHMFRNIIDCSIWITNCMCCANFCFTNHDKLLLLKTNYRFCAS